MRRDEASAESPGGETIQSLFTALEAPLLNYALRMSGERGLAEDLVQETFLRVARARVDPPRGTATLGSSRSRPPSRPRAPPSERVAAHPPDATGREEPRAQLAGAGPRRTMASHHALQAVAWEAAGCRA